MLHRYLLCLLIPILLPLTAYSHGSLSIPPSRPYYCYQTPSHPACPGTQSPITYDWNSVGRRCGAADLACNATSPPPGTLCSGGRSFSGSEYYDVPRQYHRTDVVVGENMFEYHTTAEHFGKYFVYLSKDSTDLKSVDLVLADFELVCEYEYDQGVAMKRRFPCTLPNRRRKDQLIYFNWRTKTTAPEQFMTCADVRLANANGKKKKGGKKKRKGKKKMDPTTTPTPSPSKQVDGDGTCAGLYEQCGGEDLNRRKVERNCCTGKCVGTIWWAGCTPGR